MKFPKLISKKVVFNGDFKVILAKVMLPNKNIFKENFIEWKGDTSVVVAIDNKNNIYLTKEWRPAWEKKLLTIPGGIIKHGKTSLQQAREEIREEIGMDARKLDKLITILGGVKMRHSVHIYLARDLFRSTKKRDINEVIGVVKIPFKKAYRLFLSGKERTTSYTIVGMLLAKEKLNL